MLDEWGARMLEVRFAWGSICCGSPLTRREERVNGPPGTRRFRLSGPPAGYSLEEIAALRKVKIGTVRDQVKSILTKTGTSKQAEMIKLLLTLPRLEV
jgi:hypothetical protein